jgi:hypothetical protein
MPDNTTAVITIRTLGDLAATADRREGLAMRGARALVARMEEWACPEVMSHSEVCEFVEQVLATALLDEPRTGEAADIAGTQFGSAFREHFLLLAGPLDA